MQQMMITKDRFYYEHKDRMKEKSIYKTIPHGNNRLYFRISEIYVETMQTFTTN